MIISQPRLWILPQPSHPLVKRLLASRFRAKSKKKVGPKPAEKSADLHSAHAHAWINTPQLPDVPKGSTAEGSATPPTLKHEK